MRRLLAITASAFLLLACSAVPAAAPPSAQPSATTAVATGSPLVTVDPPASDVIVAGQPLSIVAHATDTVGVARIDVNVGGVIVQSVTAPAPAGVPQLDAELSWTPTVPGPAAVVVIAYRADGTPSAPATLAVSVIDAAPGSAFPSTPVESPTDSAPTHTASPVAVTPTPVTGVGPTRRPTRTPRATPAASLPDLAVDSFYAPPTGNDGDMVDIGIVITNRGAAHAGAFTVSISQSGPAGERAYAPEEIASLRAGSDSGGIYRSVELSGAGEHTLVVTVDSANAVAESNENNNAMTATVAVAAAEAADLQLTGVQSQNANFSLTIANQGPGGAGRFVVRLTCGTHAEEGVVESLAAGSTTVVALTFPPGVVMPGDPLGEERLGLVEIDPLNEIAETDEINNSSGFVAC